MAVTFGESTTDTVNHGSAAGLDNLAQATILMWVKFLNNNQTFRSIVGKTVASPFTWELFRRGAGGGGDYRLSVSRASGAQSVDITNANITAGVWLYLVYTWDITNGGPKSYLGDLTTLAADKTANAADGAGAQSDDSARNLILGDAEASTLSIGMDTARFELYNTDLSLTAIQQRQFMRVGHPNLVLSTEYGFNGASATQRDLSGNANDGTPTGLALADHPPLRVFQPKGDDQPYLVAATGFAHSQGVIIG